MSLTRRTAKLAASLDENDPFRVKLEAVLRSASKYRIDERKYVKNDGNACPFCGSEEFEGDSGHWGGPEAWQGVSCNNCYGEWTDIYKLTGVQVSRDPSESPESLSEPAEPGYPMAQ
jgi:hypothetical protein